MDKRVGTDWKLRKHGGAHDGEVGRAGRSRPDQDLCLFALIGPVERPIALPWRSLIWHPKGGPLREVMVFHPRVGQGKRSIGPERKLVQLL